MRGSGFGGIVLVGTFFVNFLFIIAGGFLEILYPFTNTRADFRKFACTKNDDDNDPDAKETLRTSYADAGLSAEIEVYEDAMHGWCAIDSQVYHQAQAERAWSRLLNLFDRALA